MSDSTTTQRCLVLQIARDWIGTPFAMSQMVKGAGVDCGTLLCAVYGEAGIAVPQQKDLGFFARDWHLQEDTKDDERYLRIMEPFAPRVEVPRPGDIAMFRLTSVRPSPFCHSAIVVNWPYCIHAHWNSGVEYTDASQPPLKRKDVVFLSPWFQSASA